LAGNKLNNPENTVSEGLEATQEVTKSSKNKNKNKKIKVVP
jgi:hypothetical protein